MYFCQYMIVCVYNSYLRQMMPALLCFLYNIKLQLVKLLLVDG